MVFNMKKKKKESQSDTPVQLKKEIGILQGVSIVVGIIVGSGIFVSPVGVLKNTGSVGLSLVMWLVTGLFSALGAIVYAELGVTMPRSGGEYIYIQETFGPFLAFMALWITWVMIGTVSCAVNSLVFAQYLLRPFYFDCEIPKSALQLVAILALRNVSSFQDAFEGSNWNPGSLASAFYQGFWAFAGWNYLNFLTGEMKNPSRTLPIVIMLSLGTVTLIYLLANVAYLAVLSPFEVLSSGEGSAAVAVTFAARCMGVMAWVMPIFVGASVFGSINGEVLSMSRLSFTASEEGHMPAILSMVSVTNLTPIPSILALVLLSLLFQMHDDVFILIELTGLGFTFVSFVAVCSLIFIKVKHPEMNTSSFKLPLWVPILYLIVNASIGIFSIYDSPKGAALSLGLMAVGIPIYIVGIAWKTKPRSIERMMYKSTIWLQKVFNVVQPELVTEPIAVEEESDSSLVKTQYQLKTSGPWATEPSP